MGRKKRKLTSFGLWVKMRLLEQNVTQTELAQRIGTDKHVMSRILYGVIPGNKFKARIIDELGGQYPFIENSLTLVVNE